MRINHNLSAVVANNKLHQNEDVVSNSMERLSSGIRINHSKDDPAGMAISDRMTTQIDGLNQASQNASDASSLIQTADGALGEITEIIQRMRELSVQAANDTNATSDREAIQKEIAELKKEIDRMSRDTEFNTKGLLDGTLDNRVYPSKSITQTVSDGNGGTMTLYKADIERISISDYVPAGKYEMEIDPATQTSRAAGSAFTINPTSTALIGAAAAGSISINGYMVDISETDTQASAYQKFEEAAEKGNAYFDPTVGANGSLVSKYYGSQALVDVKISNPTLAAMFGNIDGGVVAQGKDAQVTPDVNSAFNGTATYSADGNHITIRQPGGFELDFMVSDEYVHTATSAPVTLEVTTMGALQVQIGANEDQTASLRIPKLDTENLYIDDLDVTTVGGADRAIGRLDWALQKVSDVRAKVGAYENRLDHAIASLDQSEENLTSAFSRINDVDMAEEMTKYTQYNVLVQASTSVLAQANDQPEMVLQLLQ